VVVAGLELDEWEPVGVVAVHLVGAHVDEHGVRRVAPTRLEEGEGATGIDVEVVEGPRRREVVARLRGGVDDELGADRGDEVVDGRAVAYVEVVVGVALAPGQEPVAVPGRVATWAEEV